jgi:hypothetical protein
MNGKRPMLFSEFVESLEKRVLSYERVPAEVDAATLCRDVLGEARLVQPDDDRWVPIKEAAAISGFSEPHLRRMRKRGEVVATGEGRSARYQVKGLPRKAGKLARDDETLQLFPSSAEQAVRESVGVP